MAYCTQCGLEGRPVLAIGRDADGEPACSGHAEKDTVTVTVSKEFCACGGEKGHKGRHRGVNYVPTEPAKALPPSKVEHAPVVRRKTPAALREPPKNDDNLFMADSITVIDLESGGKLAVMWQGDMFKMMDNPNDAHLMTVLLKVLRCRGRMMYPFDNKHTVNGETLTVQMDSGFIDDMLSMFDSPEDRGRMLAYMWERGDVKK